MKEMPAEEDSDQQSISMLSDVYVDKEWLIKELKLDKNRVIILDCRSSNEFGESHIRNAVNFSIPSIMLRRLAAGKIDLISTIRCKQLKEKIANAYRDNIFVVYADQITEQLNFANTSDTVHVLMKRLLRDGCHSVCLTDGFLEFKQAYPEWCECCSELLDNSSTGADLSLNEANVTVPLMGLRSLRISSTLPSCRQKTPALPSSSTEDSSSDSEHLDTASLSFEDDKDFPIEIVPYLYLGNAANSEDLESLSKHGIKYILNVTPDLPNKFEKLGSIKYMQIPIADHWSQNLASFFPKAIQFIDEGRSQKQGVLVHCLAGVSRSVTITVAYLMSHMSLGLNDAFSLVRSRKSNVGPNFHFMEQLHAFERELTTGQAAGTNRRSASSEDGNCDTCGTPKTDQGICNKCQMAIAHFLSPLTMFGQSPDSGIEFDRWTPGTGE